MSGAVAGRDWCGNCHLLFSLKKKKNLKCVYVYKREYSFIPLKEVTDINPFRAYVVAVRNYLQTTFLTSPATKKSSGVSSSLALYLAMSFSAIGWINSLAGSSSRSSSASDWSREETQNYVRKEKTPWKGLEKNTQISETGGKGGARTREEMKENCTDGLCFILQCGLTSRNTVGFLIFSVTLYPPILFSQRHQCPAFLFWLH